MKRRTRGQVLVMVVFLIMGILLMFALIVEVGRLTQTHAQLQGVADSAAKAGMMTVADRMVTLAAAQQTKAAESPCTPDAGYGTPAATCTATPPPENVPAWLDDGDRATLVAPPMQTQVAQAVRRQMQRNLPAEHSEVQVKVLYPYHYNPLAKDLHLWVQLQQPMSWLLAPWLGWHGSVRLQAESEQRLPQRGEP